VERGSIQAVEETERRRKRVIVTVVVRIEDESSVENKDSNPLNMEFVAAADAPLTRKGRKRRAPSSSVVAGPVSQSTRNKKKKSAQK
jgi:hypothetical protein